MKFRFTREFLYTSGSYAYRGLLDPETYVVMEDNSILNMADDCTIEYNE
jgi:hypothetical protein